MSNTLNVILEKRLLLVSDYMLRLSDKKILKDKLQELAELALEDENRQTEK